MLEIHVPENNNRKTEMDPDGISDDEGDTFPQIQRELDKLNHASTEINRLENELDEARSKYRSIISETSSRMEALSHDRKKSIHRAREYYRLKEEAKVAQGEALKAARQFQTATGVYKAAKETVALAELRLIEETDTPTAHLDSAWQEMLSHAISKVNEAEREKTKNEQQHKQKATRYAELEGRILMLEKKYATSIKKAKVYFDVKAELDIKLMQQKHNVTDLQNAIKDHKKKYAESFHTLEAISDAIHISRRNKIWSMFPRMPGVGSDKFSVSSSLSDLALVTDDTTSKASDADSEPSDEDQFIDTTSESHVKFKTEENGSRKGSDSSSPTAVNTVSENYANPSQQRQGDQNNTEKMNVNKSDAELNHECAMVIKDSKTMKNYTETECKNVLTASPVIDDSDQYIEINSEKNSSFDENSDEVFEEAYESCHESQVIDNDKSVESKTAELSKDTAVQSRSNPESIMVEGSAENEETKQTTDKISCDHNNDMNKEEQINEYWQVNQTPKDLSKKDTSVKDKTLSNKLESNIKTDTAIAACKNKPVQQDIKDIERPSLSGAED